MTIGLTGKQRASFVKDLKAHREAYTLSDAEYATQVLKVSLNTYKKCVRPVGHVPLSLQRHTFVSIFANSGLEPRNYGLTLALPNRVSQFGGYAKQDFKYLCGRYLLYRRSFLTARDITCGILDIDASKSLECLTFVERNSYTAEVGSSQDLKYSGNIYMNQERNLLSLPAYEEGNVRLMQVQPERLGNRRQIKYRGALLTFGNPKGYWQPTVSCVFANGPINESDVPLKDLCRTIHKGSEDFAALSAELERVEEHATNITPLMWAKHMNSGLF